MSAAEVKLMEGEIDKVDTWTTTADENGLFKAQNAVAAITIYRLLLAARRNLRSNPPDIPLCNYNLSLAANYYFKAIDSAKGGWRLNYIYAANVFAYLILFLTGIFLYYYSDFDARIVNAIGLEQVAHDAVLWGVIGGLLRGIWWLWRNVNRRRFRKAWKVWFASAPFLGGILGALVYFSIVAGLLVVSKQGEDAAQTLNPPIFMLFSALAGFNWQWAVARLNKIIDSKDE